MEVGPGHFPRPKSSVEQVPLALSRGGMCWTEREATARIPIAVPSVPCDRDGSSFVFSLFFEAATGTPFSTPPR